MELKKAVRKPDVAARFQPDTSQWKVEWVSIDSIKSWLENPKDPKTIQSNAKELAPLITAHGFRSPLVCWEKNKVVYKGNTTLQAAKILGIKTVPVVFAKFPSEAAAIAYGVSDNAVSKGRDAYDDQLLKRLMSSEALNTYAGGREGLRVLSGLKETDFNTMMRHTGDGMPGSLPDVDIQGLTPGKVDFLVLQFDTIEEMEEFKEKVGIKGEHGKVVQFKKLTPLLNYEPTKTDQIGTNNQNNGMIRPVKAHLRVLPGKGKALPIKRGA